jgi:nucleoside-diphosphate-sugar epimerase
LLADVTRLKQEVKWTPYTALNAGIRKTVDWWKSRKGLIS